MNEDEEFLRDLMKTFLEEGEEHIRVMSRAIVDLEAAGDSPAASAPIEALYRQTHSLKGAAGAVGRPAMVAVCQGIESVLAAVKRSELRLGPSVIDALSESVDCLHACLLIDGTANDERASVIAERLSTLADQGLEQARAQQTPATAPESGMMQPPTATIPPPATSAPAAPVSAAVPPAGVAQPTAAPQPGQAASPPRDESAARAAQAVDMAATTTDTVRVSTAKLESLMLQAEEFIAVKLTTNQRSAALRDLNVRLETWKREWYQAHISGKPEKMTEFIEWNSSFMDGLMADMRMLSKSADDERRTIGPMVDDLLEGMKRVLMLPVSSLLSSLPKMVRDLARARGKQAELVITGADIEIDKRVIENLKDPLIHLLRNSVDHGIETPEVRQNAGKPARGVVRISVKQLENNKIRIDVSDDGAGIDLQRLRETAIRGGYRTQLQVDEADDAEVLRLVFASGLSTTRVVSNVSGRGIGLSIVEEKVEELGGSVSVQSQAGWGTLFRITVPATLATARGILAQVSDWPFVIPVSGIERVIRVRRDDIRLVENRETIQLEGRTLPLVYLNEVLELPLKTQRNGSDHLQVVVAGSGDERVAVAVDRIIDEQEVLVKTLGPQLVRVRNIAGGTIIGSGKVVPIINISDLLQSCRGVATWDGRPAAPAGSNGGEARKSVLVVEDSITSRMLIKNLLESAGYYVRPSVDGVDALSALREEDFDLVISDIEMPRMDGFELTSKIREDPRLNRLPVMLVTGLESQEHRERGIDVGANAYVAKSSFTQGTLLETARSLM